ncbi:helix-turn-helix transcriptional regulator [Virgibacillus sediminis]|uniref:Helix-turn-helix transcriptional regulator n=1 Tax=Virgibacillus sediminis TaxID=202260 RepID=A0ABV7A8B6_9BACI
MQIIYLSKEEFIPEIEEGLRAQSDIILVGSLHYNKDAGELAIMLGVGGVIWDVDGVPAEEVDFLIKYLKGRKPDMAVVLVTACTDDTTLYQLLCTEADSLIIKDEQAPVEAARAIRSIQSECYYLSAEKIPLFLTRLDELENMNRNIFHQKLGKKHPELSRKEAEIAYYLMRGYKNPAIARKLNMNPTTVKVHVSHIYNKLSIKGRKNLTSFLKKTQNTH